ncbi:MAG: N-acetyl-gamma-glutamyl-phosphate reductase [Bacteroidota bacterium]
MKKIKVAITGAAGYTGGELIRLLLNHPQTELVNIHSTSNAGKSIHTVHADLLGETNLLFNHEPFTPADVLFLCVGHGDAKKFLDQHSIPTTTKIIDLSQDFRLTATAVHGERTFIYGLPELNKEVIVAAQNIANPGCFATAIQLALLPLAKAGILSDVHTTGITGSTGAGQSLSNTSHFSWRANNVQAYKSLNHQHIKEITTSLNQLQTDSPLSVSGEGPGVHFVPWRGDFTRGIYTSSVIDCSLPLEEVKAIYRKFYADAVFTHYSEEMIDLKQVVNTNKCLVHVEKQGNKMVVHSAIDNLLKGASGQAVQNMNLLFGLDEKTGLQLKANYF